MDSFLSDEMAAAAADMAWADSTDQPEARQPGRALQMHEKLSSPSRKRFVIIGCIQKTSFEYQ